MRIGVRVRVRVRVTAPTPLKPCVLEKEQLCMSASAMEHAADCEENLKLRGASCRLHTWLRFGLGFRLGFGFGFG